MRVEIGYSENPDTRTAGRHAAEQAVVKSGRTKPCDMVLLFATARHDFTALREAVAAVVGACVPIVGGGAVGAISNDRFGYAGDQIVLAAMWFDRVRCDILVEGGLDGNEFKVGHTLGQRLEQAGIGRDAPVLLFYDAIDRSQGEMRMIMGTPLLQGIECGLGYFPTLAGAGLQGDYINTPVMQWIGGGMGKYQAIALAFSGAIRMREIVMHGCRPATPYYTVTKTDAQTILEINGEPALPFLDRLLGSSIAPEEYPFFLILGVNRGDKWGAFDEENYANRLCLAIDRKREGIVMFEPDMVVGTEFQIMYRNLDLDYIPPRIERLFGDIGDDEQPVFALYIDCAGRAAGYGGTDLEDAIVVQRAVGTRVPLMGIYTGVEIASVAGQPRGLDWTGVFCLFSIPKN